MSTSGHRTCVYLSDTRGIHDRRWIGALESVGYTVLLEVPDTMEPDIPIVAGPLTTMNRDLLRLPNPVVGLSWGFDLHQLNAIDDTSWLPLLSGLIVDSIPTWEIATQAGVSAHRIAVIPWGIDLQLFNSQAPTKPRDKLQILTLRAHEDLYNVDTVITAVAELTLGGISCELVVGNTGSLTERLVQLSADLGLANVDFIGRIEESDLPCLFDKADVYVSAAETDGTSVTLLQAMSMKVPVIVSDSPGNQAILYDSHQKLSRGTLFPTGDSAALAQALRDFALHRDAYGNLTEAAWEYVQNNADWGANVQRLIPLLNFS